MADSANLATSPPDPAIVIGGVSFALNATGQVTKDTGTGPTVLVPNPGSKLLIRSGSDLVLQGQSGSFYVVNQTTGKVQATLDPRLIMPNAVPLTLIDLLNGVAAKTVTVQFAFAAIRQFIEDGSDQRDHQADIHYWNTYKDVVDKAARSQQAYAAADLFMAARNANL
jgi:hypothetical protein